jgi:hypothetical protein
MLYLEKYQTTNLNDNTYEDKMREMNRILLE